MSTTQRMYIIRTYNSIFLYRRCLNLVTEQSILKNAGQYVYTDNSSSVSVGGNSLGLCTHP